jgi:hypothetical protein
MTLYLGVGDNLADNNIINIAAVLFMCAAGSSRARGFPSHRH